MSRGFAIRAVIPHRPPIGYLFRRAEIANSIRQISRERRLRHGNRTKMLIVETNIRVQSAFSLCPAQPQSPRKRYDTHRLSVSSLRQDSVFLSLAPVASQSMSRRIACLHHICHRQRSFAWAAQRPNKPKLTSFKPSSVTDDHRGLSTAGMLVVTWPAFAP